jgi:hypothetical protein
MVAISATKDWNKYVVNNNAWNTTDFPIENNVVQEPVFQSVPQQDPDKITAKGYLSTGDIVRLVTATKTQGYRGSNYVLVKMKSGALLNQSGYIRVTKVRKPGARNVSTAEDQTLNITKQKLDTMIYASGIGRGSRAGCTIEVPGLGYFDEITNVDKAPDRRFGREVKADFYLKNSFGIRKLFISHKDGSAATDFGQYGGISVKSGTNEDPELISNDPEVVSYTDALYRLYAAAIGSSTQITGNPFDKNGKMIRATYRYVNSKTLIGRSVYGPEYGGAFGPENVHCLAQGSFNFEAVLSDNDDLTFKLRMSGHLNVNPDVSYFDGSNSTGESTGYRAAIITTFRTGRNTTSTQGTIPKTRTGIYPFAYRPNAIAI